MVETGLSRASVSGYLPYQKIVYGVDELSVAAERTDKYRRRKNAECELHERRYYGRGTGRNLVRLPGH